MAVDSSVADVPATERVLVGLCHGLNDRLAAITAYLFLLERDEQLGELGEALHDQLAEMTRSVRLIRSLVREDKAEIEPVALSLLAESAGALMEAYPDGPVEYRVRRDHAGRVIRCDWSRTLRALVTAGAWISRGTAQPLVAELTAESEDKSPIVGLRALGDVPAPPDEKISSESGIGFTLKATGSRAVEVHLTDTR